MELLGNETLKQSLEVSFRTDKLSHGYLLCGPQGSGKHTLAAILAAAMQCTAGSGRPCGTCPACRKVFHNVHPDVITVDDTAHKGVGVEVIRTAREDLYIRPNEGRRKVYVIPRAGDMNPSAQNALLKALEEPPAYGAFLLLTDAEEKLLPTIRSRCVTLRLAPLDEKTCVDALGAEFPGRDAAALRAAWQRAGGWYGQAKALLAAPDAAPETERYAAVFAARDRLGLTELLVPLEGKKRDVLAPLFQEWISLLAEALRVRAGLEAVADAPARIARSRTAADCLAAAGHLRRAVELLNGNVGPANVCAALQVWLMQ